MSAYNPLSACEQRNQRLIYGHQGSASLVAIQPECEALVVESQYSQANAMRALEAVRSGNFDLQLQPIRPLCGHGATSWAEVLIRPPHTSAAHLMALAEETGAAPEVDYAVWRQSLPLLGRVGRLSLNVSAQTVSQAVALPSILGMLREFAVGAQHLVFEITETALITDLPSALKFARTLRELGAAIALDDVQHTDLAIPIELVDYIKVDRSIIAGRRECAMAALCALGRSTGRQLIAEGVETADELAMVHGHGAQWYQGYYADGAGQRIPAYAAEVA